MEHLLLGVTSTTAEGAARLVDGPKVPIPGPSFAVDPLILVAVAAVLLALVAAWWGGFFGEFDR